MEKYMKHFLPMMRRAKAEGFASSFDDVFDEDNDADAKKAFGKRHGDGEEGTDPEEDDIPAFAVTASNVYRTKHFIVRQRLAYNASNLFGGLLCSHDTYYVRTRNRDREYEGYFSDRLDLDGKRIPALMYTREYFD